MTKLTAEEQDILDAFEAGTLKRSANARKEIALHREYAAVTLENSRRKIPVNVKIVVASPKRVQS